MGCIALTLISDLDLKRHKMNDSEKPIGIFDSGLGGLTVLKEVRKLLPNESLIYFGDSGRAPYGTKSGETVRAYTKQDIAFLLSKGVKAVVVACNTAAACAGRDLLDSFGVPVVDVIGAGSEEAVRVTSKGKIGVIGTSATVNSGVYERAIKKLLPGAEFKAKACPLFVPLVEEGWWDNDITCEVAKKYLCDIDGVDTLVLGCTHYPYLENVIQKVAGADVTLVNSAKAVALKLDKTLEKQGLKKKGGAATTEYFTSDSVEKFAALGELFLGDLGGNVSRADTEAFS